MPGIPEIPPEMGPKAVRDLLEDERTFADGLLLAQGLRRRGWDNRRGPRDLHYQIPVMRTPLALQLAGMRFMPIYATADKLNRMMEEHPSLTPTMLAYLPRAVADPIAIFRRMSQGKRGIVTLLRMVDMNGINVMAAFHMNQSCSGFFVDELQGANWMPSLEESDWIHTSKSFHKLATAYPPKKRRSKGATDSAYARMILSSSLCYTDAGVLKTWFDARNLQQTFNPAELDIPKRENLIAIWRLRRMRYERSGAIESSA